MVGICWSDSIVFLSGYLETACKTLAECLDRLPGDGRTQVGFITFDRSLHFYSLSEGASQHQMFVVSDVDGKFELVDSGLAPRFSKVN